MEAAANPSLYQINTRIALGELSTRLGRSATLDDISDGELDRIASLKFDWVWFLGVWQTGEAGRAVSMSQPQWVAEYRATLPDFTLSDVTGSPFAITKYVAHEDFGGDEALARLRARLASRGLKLLLDFVPNHTAIDHEWVVSNPEYYVSGTAQDLASEPQNYVQITVGQGNRVFAHGRDPYFDGWPDTVQLNYRHPGFRKAMLDQLVDIATKCDGVRCDMAMLLLPEVFIKTWGAKSVPGDDVGPVDVSFWPEAISAVRAAHPEFLFMAEVYWDMEYVLQQQGFDYTYDKRLYDRLKEANAYGVIGHLHADEAFQAHSARFLENHDEPRAASAFPDGVREAAAIITYLVPGLRFFHGGQFDGRKTRISMHLGRRPYERPDARIQSFYDKLLTVLKRPAVRTGRWTLQVTSEAWQGNTSWERFVCFSWSGEGVEQILVAVNFGPTQGQCYVRIPSVDAPGEQLVLRDLTSDARYERSRRSLDAPGLYLDMPGWAYHVFVIGPR